MLMRSLSQHKNGRCDPLRTVCFHDRVHEISDIIPAVTVLARIGYIVCFHQNLVVQTIYIPESMVMPDEVYNPPDLHFRQPGFRKEIRFYRASRVLQNSLSF